MRLGILLLMLYTYMLPAIGQNHVPDMTLERDFAAQVKSIDEFMARFNGVETNPEVKTDSLRRDNILALFDYDMPHNGLDDEAFRSLLTRFARTSINSGCKLSLDGHETYAEADCIVKYIGKEQHITLIMVREQTDKGTLRWAIAGLKGLEQMGLYDEKRMTISPVDHELHFMSLQDFFQENRDIVPSMRSVNKDIDELSMFFGLCLAKAIEFEFVNDLKFHFTAVPGFVFTVEEKGRRGINSGWLITRLLEMHSGDEKESYVKHLFGLER